MLIGSQGRMNAHTMNSKAARINAFTIASTIGLLENMKKDKIKSINPAMIGII